MTPEAAIIQSMFRVVNKESQDVDFILNAPQKLLDDNLTKRNIIPKARQEGISTYFLARYTAACLMHRNVKAVIISHDSESTQRLLTRCNYFLNNLRCEQAPVVGRSSLNTITLPKMDSTIYIGTAGNKQFGRGDTITHLHCSEYAYWPDPKGLLSGLLQAVPLSGEISIESTGNGKGNDYHRRCMRAFEGQSTWKCHFFAWHTFHEYSLPLNPEDEVKILSNLIVDWKEPDLIERYGLTAGQIAWRRLKLEELDYDIGLFEQEYPMEINECFKPSGASLFQHVNFKPTDDWEYQGNHLYVLKGHPFQEMTYSIGVDPAGGAGGDNAGIEIFCCQTGEQVAEYANNKIEPDALGVKAVELAVQFNGAFLTVESNNHGPVTIKAIRDEGYPDILLYTMPSGATEFEEDRTLMQIGFKTTKRTKPLLIGKLRTDIVKDLIIHSQPLADELSTFIETESGALEAQANCKDDRVISTALSNLGISKALLYATISPYNPNKVNVVQEPFTFESIIDEMQNKRSGFPIAPQHETIQ